MKVCSKEIIGVILSHISQFYAFQRQFLIIFAFTSTRNSPSDLFLQCFSNHKIFVYVFRMFAVHAIFLGYRFFFIQIGLAVINDVL
jgi:hypothetical protein